MYRFISSLNNNIALVEDEYGNEKIVFGKGIGFKKKRYTVLRNDEIQKVFTIEKDIRFSKIIDEIPREIILLVEDIVNKVNYDLSITLNPSIYLTLADHLNMAQKRKDDKIQPPIPFDLDFIHLYSNEYAIGNYAIHLAKTKYGLELQEIEAFYITMHIINAQTESANMNRTMKVVRITKEIVDVLMEELGEKVDPTSLAYSRFITHVRYFLIRQSEGIEEPENQLFLNSSFVKELEAHYRTSYLCAQKVISYLEFQYGWEISPSELVYLVLHIGRMIQDEAERKEKGEKHEISEIS